MLGVERGILLKETGQIIDLWPSPHLRLLLLLNIPSSKRNGCIGKQDPDFHGLQREVATERCPGNRIGKGITRFLTKSRLENDSRSDQ
jgi:hypothetical protein|uniref:Uncharacterized protein n=1 Tax=Picea glauca TaxID=3330 RepID=A0A101LZS9_PICGL|nr:hypothetical protein ABT39_MTgene5339 [Picea glauca]QHR88920.1 hypothetical protein Q903MT_gene2939 [Picea sitchensis]